MKYLIIGLLALVSFSSCEHHKSYHSVKVYRQHQADDTWLYYYVMFNSFSNSYYYTSSPTPVSNYSTMSWTSVKENPVQNVQEIEELPQEIVETEQLSEDIAEDMSSDVDAYDSNAEAESGGYDSADSGGDFGGDSGGGDSGGDGGGGGE